jgi:hypothetical protein
MATKGMRHFCFVGLQDYLLLLLVLLPADASHSLMMPVIK